MKKVLIIDDSATTRAVLKVYLSGHSLEFHESDNGKEGLALAQSWRPDVIILDLKLPGIDGLSFCRQARMNPVLSRTPIILISAIKAPDIRAESKRAGASAYLAKPIDVPTLGRLVLSFLGGGGGLSGG